MLEINEIFGPTIQGEGKLIGTPSIFIRLGKCNMSCAGFGVEYKTPNGEIKKSCDTYYAVDPAFKKEWQKLDCEETVNKVSKLLPNYKIDIVITGGEPLLYWKNEEFQKLLKYYVEENHTVTIETNASLDIKFTQDYQRKLLFSMSVKLSNSFEPEKKRININTLKEISSKTLNSYLKFVVDKNSINIVEKEIIEIRKKVGNIEIYLMPLGSTVEEIDKNSETVINMAIKNGFKYSDRLHIRIWDNKRGV
ncbi:MAG: 7-carboxy-7-deazaguanine synthase QueE [Arcobacter sp.]|nr:MAG: 7-carboxy-7-deazaguanine synthase QueE [Arcobacter sp.]